MPKKENGNQPLCEYCRRRKAWRTKIFKAAMWIFMAYFYALATAFITGALMLAEGILNDTLVMVFGPVIAIALVGAASELISEKCQLNPIGFITLVIVSLIILPLGALYLGAMMELSVQLQAKLLGVGFLASGGGWAVLRGQREILFRFSKREPYYTQHGQTKVEGRRWLPPGIKGWTDLNRPATAWATMTAVVAVWLVILLQQLSLVSEMMVWLTVGWLLAIATFVLFLCLVASFWLCIQLLRTRADGNGRGDDSVD